MGFDTKLHFNEALASLHQSGSQKFNEVNIMLSRVIAVTNKKGGVGKTTSTLNLAAALHTVGKKVLMVDNDHQGNLTAAVGLTPAEQKYTLANLLLTAIDYPEDVQFHLQRTVLHFKDGMDLIPANKRLSDAAARLQVM